MIAGGDGKYRRDAGTFLYMGILKLKLYKLNAL